MHITELSWQKVTMPEKVVALNEAVRCQILSMDPRKGRINLSIKVGSRSLRSGLSVAVLCGLWYASRAVSCCVGSAATAGCCASLASGPAVCPHQAVTQLRCKPSPGQGVPAAVPQLAVKARQGMAQALLAPAGLPIITDD